jgi:glycosyltransferase involved in cell wall biosynthesis
MDQNNDIYKWIKLFVNKYKLNVIFLENINRNDLLNLYKSCEYLVYPSTFEAYGLPLIEALNYNLKVLCADLDYCWDLIKPFDFFNPYDASSIERCILRRYDYNLNSTKILTPKEFLNKIIK